MVEAIVDSLSVHATRLSRKSELGKALAYMLMRQPGFRLFLEEDHLDMDSNLVENAIRSPAMNHRNALFAGHDEGGRSCVRMASLIGSTKMNGVDPYLIPFTSSLDWLKLTSTRTSTTSCPRRPPRPHIPHNELIRDSPVSSL